MSMPTVQRVGPVLKPDPRRVLIRPFEPHKEETARQIAARVMAIPESQVSPLLASVLGEFGARHEHLEEFLQRRYRQVRRFLPPDASPWPERQLLLASYFTHEYSIEAAALFNPSIVPHPDQTGLAEGALRFILSLRATGEGHISSITFRTGIISPQHRIPVNPRPVS